MENEMERTTAATRTKVDLKKLTVTTDDKNVSVPLRSILLFLCATLATAVVLEFLPIGDHPLWHASKYVNNSDVVAQNVPKYAIYGQSPTEEHLVHVLYVLDRLGYQRTTLEADDWDLLWAHDYPYIRMPQRFKQLAAHQVVNHFPGIGFITNKVDLCTTPLPFLPRAFRLPAQSSEFLDYAKEHPTALFVEKHNEHRHIHIRAPSEIRLNSSDSFVQEFVQHPFLVDGYKFDIGVYVVITCVDPLRAYIYTGDVLFRYCPIKYYPFDASVLDKYIVGDDYLPTWEVPSLRKYYQRFGGSMRSTFDAYVRDQGLDPSVIWPQVEHIIRRTLLAKEANLLPFVRTYKTRNFFELMRFDLIIDEKLKVHLMEANMSPNLSSAHFKSNSLLYEQILYSVLNLVGVGSPLKRKPLGIDSPDNEEMVTAEKNLATDLNRCAAYDCDRSCNIDACDLCLPCLSGSDYEILGQAHREHLQRFDMKRIFPTPITDLRNYKLENVLKHITTRNAWLTRWYYNKCVYDNSWCL